VYDFVDENSARPSLTASTTSAPTALGQRGVTMTRAFAVATIRRGAPDGGPCIRGKECSALQMGAAVTVPCAAMEAELQGCRCNGAAYGSKPSAAWHEQ